MTYKAIIKNMIELKAVRKAEKLMTENGVKLDWTSTDEDKIIMDNKTDLGVTFEITFEVVKIGAERKTVRITGFVDEYGTIHNCTLWKCGADEWSDKLVWTCSDGIANNWELLR